jgi:hypothetical protein
VQDDRAEVRLPGQKGISTLRFDSLQRILLGSPPARWADIADRHVRTALEAARRGSEAPMLSELLPRVGPVNRDRSAAAPWEEWLVDGQLSLRLVIDMPNAVRFVRPLDLAHWQISLFDAKQAAVDNLLARTPVGTLDPLGRGAFRVATGDSYDATRVLLAETWFPDHPGVFAILPARDLLYLIPANGKEDVRSAAQVWAEVTEEADRLPYPISRGLFWFAPRQPGRAIAIERPLTGDGADVFLTLPEDVAVLLDEQ